MKVVIEYSKEEVRITDLRIYYHEIVENPLRILRESWKIKTGNQIINPKVSVKLADVDCLQNTISYLEILPPMRPTWGEWSEWSECSKSCGEGTRSQSRKCIAKGPWNFLGIPRDCDGGDTKHQSCFITCVKEKSTVSPAIEIGTKATDQTTLSCELVHYAVSYTFHNGVAKCPQFGSGWRYPPSKFQRYGTFNNFWIAARQTGGKWVDEFNQDIAEPDFVPARRKRKMDLLPVGDTVSSDICLYWQSGYILAGPCDATRIVICCEPSATASIEIAQGKNYHTISRKYVADKRSPSL